MTLVVLRNYIWDLRNIPMTCSEIKSKPSEGKLGALRGKQATPIARTTTPKPKDTGSWRAAIPRRCSKAFNSDYYIPLNDCPCGSRRMARHEFFRSLRIVRHIEPKH